MTKTYTAYKMPEKESETEQTNTNSATSLKIVEILGPSITIITQYFARSIEFKTK